VFTAAYPFDLHQRMRADGETVCLDPETAMKRNGSPVFAAYRKLADGTPVWGQHDPRGDRRPVPLEARGAQI
jgi:hypothetical protein